VDWLERSIRDGDVIYDVGANVGAYSLVAARMADATVIAFEPAFANYQSLCENVLLNDLAARVMPLPVGLAESTGLAWLACDDTAAGAATHSLGGDNVRALYRQPVLAYALDDLISVFGLPAPTVLKVDVDGAETIVLAGARATLARPALRTILIEVDETQTDGVLRLMGDAGLQLVARFDERAGRPLPGIWYGIFERR
jgi:FkbM family methyltransferase